MKELVNLCSRFIGFCGEAETLKGNTFQHLTFYIFLSYFFIFTYLFFQRHCIVLTNAPTIWEKLRASDEAHEKAEEDVAGVEDLRRRLQAAEDSLSDREANIVQCDNDIIMRLEMQSQRFSSNTISPFFNFSLC
jgi:hypothetical protein